MSRPFPAPWKGPTVRRTPTLAALLTAALLALTGCGAGESGSGDGEPPSVPRGLTVQASSATSVHVMWNKATDNVAITGYEIYRGNKLVKKAAATQYMVDLNGLTPKATYRFSVRAKDAAGNRSPVGSPVSVTMRPPAPEDRTPPAAPTRLRAKASGPRAATLTWDASKSAKDITSYDIYQRDTKIHSVEGTATGALITGLRPATAYTFTVKARDAADNSSKPSGAVDLTTASAPDDNATGSTAPADLQVRTHDDDGAYYLDLSWDPPKTGGDVSAYEIYLNGRQTTTLMWGSGAPEGRAKHSFFITREAGETYRVKLRARLPDGNWGAFSAERTAVTGGD
ncbi:fibronectin type III domain-containing protein [Streptomyces sp. NBC_01304]|uniref:fibronectin type III domain-containing protein n=1 Tax=Streptomyces sp. NBC_01304 TaxID=2903818 RepID=UPI003FA39930|nr:fibronectin type III domain-containing protein [Streptomyces sp. NBC_01304]